MNRIYQSIWNDNSGTFVAASENARSTGKKSSSGAVAGVAHFALKGLAASLLLAFGANVYALPTGGVVSAGGASIASGAGKTTVSQSSQNVAINWQGFSIGSSEAVQFVQPNSNSVALNRVLGADPSSILGSLSANGKVFLVNPNGILFGKGAQVNVGGLVASTRNISDADFMSGNYKFSGSGGGAVLNQGSINAEGGYVALLGASVSNEGVISAKLGTVALAAGNAMTLDVAGDGLLNVSVDQGAVNALIQNGGLIQADGGQVLLSAQAAGNLLQSVVNNTGVIQAQSVENHNGTIRLLGGMQNGTVNVSGTLDASGTGAGQSGGNVTVTGEHVGLFGGHINAAGDAGGGTVLVGGDFQGKNIDVPNAAATYMSADSTITADAITNGNGGKVILWSDDSTRAYGSLSARGGAQGGDGGLIETSGHWLDVAGSKVSANAPSGNNGTWLLDPANIIISGAATSGMDPLSGGVFAPSSTVNNAIVNVGDLQATLAAGTNVKLTTTNNGTPGTGVGNITVDAAIVYSTAAGVTLELNAANDVIVNFAITASKPGNKIVLTAGNDVRILAALVASEINTRITLTAGNDVIATFPITASGNGAKIEAVGGRNIALFTTTADGGGSVSARANVDVTVNGHINSTAAGATGGTVLLRADDDGSGPGVIGGTVKFGAGGDVSTDGTTTVRFNPAGYANTTAEIAAYVAKITAGGRDIQAWVFGQGVDKIYNGNAIDTLVFRNPLADNPNVGNTVTLNGGTATFNTKDVGALKPVTFNGYTLGGPDLTKFNLYSVFGVASGDGTTTANITPAPLTIKSNDFTKFFGEVPTLSTSAFTLPVVPVAGETVGSVTNTSPGTVAIASVGGSPYVITPSSPTGGTFNASNYTITFQTGLLTVLPLVVTLPPEVAPVETLPITPVPIETLPVETLPIASGGSPLPSEGTAPLLGFVSNADYVPEDTLASQQTIQNSAGRVFRGPAGLNLTVVDNPTPVTQLAQIQQAPPPVIFVPPEQPAPVIAPPVVAPPEAPPVIYVPPVRPPRQERN